MHNYGYLLKTRLIFSNCLMEQKLCQAYFVRWWQTPIPEVTKKCSCMSRLSEQCSKKYTEPTLKKVMDHGKLKFLNPTPIDILWVNYGWIIHLILAGWIWSWLCHSNCLCFPFCCWEFQLALWHVLRFSSSCSSLRFDFHWWSYRGEGQRDFLSKNSSWVSRVKLISVSASLLCTTVLCSCSNKKRFQMFMYLFISLVLPQTGRFIAKQKISLYVS